MYWIKAKELTDRGKVLLFGIRAGYYLFPCSVELLLDRIRKIIREEKDPFPSISRQPPEGLTNKPLYTFSEIMKLLSISKPTVYKWISAGKLHPVKIRSKVYFKGSEVDKIIN